MHPNRYKAWNQKGWLQARQIAVAEQARLLFHPSGSVIQCFELLTGDHLYNLKGHMDAVNACCFNQATQELYTGSNDHQICTWSTKIHQDEDEEDQWSSWPLMCWQVAVVCFVVSLQISLWNEIMQELQWLCALALTKLLGSWCEDDPSECLLLSRSMRRLMNVF